MTFLKKIEGNYIEVLAHTNLASIFADVSHNAPAQIELDLPRTAFVDFNGRSFETYKATWRNENISHAFTQGNMDGRFFSDLLFQQFILSYESFVGHGRADDDRMDYYSQKNKGSLAFGYYNNQNVCCGFAFSYSKIDPSLWVISIIQNTTAHPQDRVVTLFTYQDFFPHLPDSEFNKNHVLASINNTEIQTLLTNILNLNGEANLVELEEVNKRIQSDNNIDSRDTNFPEFTQKLAALHQYARMHANAHLQQIANKISMDSTQTNFFQSPNYLKSLRLMTEIERFEMALNPAAVAGNMAQALNDNIEEKDDEAILPDNSPDLTVPGAMVGVQIAAQEVFNAAVDVMIDEPEAAQELHEILEDSAHAIANLQNAGQLLVHADACAKKNSKFWQKLAGGLCILFGTLMVLAGLALTFATSGMSLILAAAGAVLGTLGDEMRMDAMKINSPNPVERYKDQVIGPRDREDLGQIDGTESPPTDSGFDEEETPPFSPSSSP